MSPFIVDELLKRKPFVPFSLCYANGGGPFGGPIVIKERSQAWMNGEDTLCVLDGAGPGMSLLVDLNRVDFVMVKGQLKPEKREIPF